MLSFLQKISVSGIVIAALAFALSGCNSEDAFGVIPPSQIELERIDIVATPVKTSGADNLTLAIGNKQPFSATGHYSDGSSRIITDEVLWNSSDDDVATISVAGLLSAAAAGSTTVTASLGEVTSNAVAVTVSDAVVTAIQVTPSPVNLAKGQQQQLAATASYSDGTSADISTLVAWLSADTGVATVTPAGLLSAAAAGSTTVTASLGEVTSNAVA
ncbi:Ig-like domain-containing protein, partial [Shewanella sp. 38A_GOM-205m]|uniref:Ig-like domain-containing protein n=1 Tax=Shewanella sp. 38A_GOM-205m TaxID=1380363 RepID=UPI0018CC691C